MKPTLPGLLVILVTCAAAQEQAGRMEGVVLDSGSHQPIKKASVSIVFTGAARGGTQNQTPPTAITDGNGAFVFQNLAAGQYQLTAIHQNYPQAMLGGVHKTVQVAAGENATSVTVEMVPGAAVSGHIVDEDGDPLNGCVVQVHPALKFNRGMPLSTSMPREDGSHRIYRIPPGKYTITAQCRASVFQPRPLSEGPDPPPSAAYPMQFYPAASDLKSAEVVELLPGAEKSGVNFQMRPSAVTHIRGRLAAGSADWWGRSDLRVQLIPLEAHDPRTFGLAAGAQVNPKDGSFELRAVFPGSYRLVVFSQDFSAAGAQGSASNRIGAVARVDVADQPIELALQLQRAMDVSGTVEIERSRDTTNQITPSQIGIQLTSRNQFGGPMAPAQVNEDGTFTLKSVVPGEWQIQLMAPLAFVKSAWLGDNDVTGRPLDLTSGVAPPLRILVSTNTATIRGTAPAGQMVFCARLEGDESSMGWRGAQVDSSGQFTLPGLAPGKYRVEVGDNGGPVAEEGGQEVTVREGVTATIEIKAETKP